MLVTLATRFRKDPASEALHPAHAIDLDFITTEVTSLLPPIPDAIVHIFARAHNALTVPPVSGRS